MGRAGRGCSKASCGDGRGLQRSSCVSPRRWRPASPGRLCSSAAPLLLFRVGLGMARSGTAAGGRAGEEGVGMPCDGPLSTTMPPRASPHPTGRRFSCSGIETCLQQLVRQHSAPECHGCVSMILRRPRGRDEGRGANYQGTLMLVGSHRSQPTRRRRVFVRRLPRSRTPVPTLSLRGVNLAPSQFVERASSSVHPSDSRSAERALAAA